MPMFTRSGLLKKGKFIPAASDEDAMQRANAELAAVPQPGLEIPPSIATGATDTLEPLPDGEAGPQELGPPTISYSGESLGMPTTSPGLPIWLPRPKYSEVGNDQYGQPTTSPRLTRLGNLVSVIRAAVQGGMAGQAAAEQAVVASGGHSSAGFGTGFEAGRLAPALEVARRQALERGALANEAERQNIALAPQRIALQNANIKSEIEQRQAHANYWRSIAGIRDKETLQQMYADAVH